MRILFIKVYLVIVFFFHFQLLILFYDKEIVFVGSGTLYCCNPSVCFIFNSLIELITIVYNKKLKNKKKSNKHTRDTNDMILM